MENPKIKLYCPRCKAYLSTYDFKYPKSSAVRCKFCGNTYRYDGDRKIWDIIWGYLKTSDSSGKRLN